MFDDRSFMTDVPPLVDAPPTEESALQLIDWGLSRARRPIVTTNFGPYSAVLLHLLTLRAPKIPVVWMDSGYATEATYRFADELSRKLDLDLHIFHPRRSRAHREAVEGPVPEVGDPRHAAFTQEVKLEPFERAMREMAPDVWFAALRAEQTAERARMEAVATNPDGLIKVSPLLHWSSRQMYAYVQAHGLPNNFDYFDPTKVEEKRECGLHIAH